MDAAPRPRRAASRLRPRPPAQAARLPRVPETSPGASPRLRRPGAAGGAAEPSAQTPVGLDTGSVEIGDRRSLERESVGGVARVAAAPGGPLASRPS